MSILACFFLPHPPIILKEIGKGEETLAIKTIDSMNKMATKIAELKPETIVVISPHSVIYDNYIGIASQNTFNGNFKEFNAKDVVIECDNDLELVAEISKEANLSSFPAGTLDSFDSNLDHGVMVPLYFIKKKYSDFKLVRCSVSNLEAIQNFEFGIMLTKAIENILKKCVIVVSGDLSHRVNSRSPYGTSTEGSVFDRAIVETLTYGNFKELFSFESDFVKSAATCSLEGLQMLAGILNQKSFTPKLYSYEAPYGIGYAVASFTDIKKDEDNDLCGTHETYIGGRKIKNGIDPYVKLAKMALSEYVKNHIKIAPPVDIDKELLTKRSGVFVSLKENGMLRGCIGTIFPTQKNVAEEIIYNAINAGVHDPRFSPVKESELNNLLINVDEISDIEKISSSTELDIKKYGVIVRFGSKLGLLLPDIEGIKSVDEQIDIARQKGAINKDDNYTLERFKVIRHK